MSDQPRELQLAALDDLAAGRPAPTVSAEEALRDAKYKAWRDRNAAKMPPVATKATASSRLDDAIFKALGEIAPRGKKNGKAPDREDALDAAVFKTLAEINASYNRPQKPSTPFPIEGHISSDATPRQARATPPPVVTPGAPALAPPPWTPPGQFTTIEQREPGGQTLYYNRDTGKFEEERPVRPRQANPSDPQVRMFRPIERPADVDYEAYDGMQEFYRQYREAVAEDLGKQDEAQAPTRPSIEGTPFPVEGHITPEAGPPTEQGEKRPSLRQFFMQGFEEAGWRIGELFYLDPAANKEIDRIVALEARFRLQNGLYDRNAVATLEEEQDGKTMADLRVLGGVIRTQLLSGMPMIDQVARQGQETLYRELAPKQVGVAPKGYLEHSANFLGEMLPFIATTVATGGVASALGAGPATIATAELAGAAAYGGATAPRGERLKSMATAAGIIKAFRVLGKTGGKAGERLGAKVGERFGRAAEGAFAGKIAGATAAESAGFAGTTAAAGRPTEEIVVAGVLGPVVFRAAGLAGNDLEILSKSRASGDRMLGNLARRAKAGGVDVKAEFQKFLDGMSTGKISLTPAGRKILRQSLSKEVAGERAAKQRIGEDRREIATIKKEMASEDFDPRRKSSMENRLRELESGVAEAESAVSQVREARRVAGAKTPKPEGEPRATEEGVEQKGREREHPAPEERRLPAEAGPRDRPVEGGEEAAKPPIESRTPEKAIEEAGRVVTSPETPPPREEPAAGPRAAPPEPIAEVKLRGTAEASVEQYPGRAELQQAQAAFASAKKKRTTAREAMEAREKTLREQYEADKVFMVKLKDAQKGIKGKGMQAKRAERRASMIRERLRGDAKLEILQSKYFKSQEAAKRADDIQVAADEAESEWLTGEINKGAEEYQAQLRKYPWWEVRAEVERLKREGPEAEEVLAAEVLAEMGAAGEITSPDVPRYLGKPTPKPKMSKADAARLKARGKAVAEYAASPGGADKEIAKGLDLLNRFIATVPEFKLDPTFTLREDGRLEFQDGGLYVFEPRAIGIVLPADMKPGQGLTVDPKLVSKMTIKAGKVLQVSPAAPEKQSPITEAEPGPSAMPSSHAFRQPKEMRGEHVAQVSAARLVEMMEKAASIKILVGHGDFARRKAAGWFNVGRYVIRQKFANELGTAAHEFGHAVNDKIIGWKTQWPAGVRDELLIMGKELYGKRKPSGGYRREGFAEYTARLFLGDESISGESAPQTHKWFNEVVLPEHPQFAKQWAAIAESYEVYREQGAIARLDSMIKWMETGPAAKIKGGYQWLTSHFSRKMWTNDAALFEGAVQKVIKETEWYDIRPDQDPAQLRAMLLLGAPGQARHAIQVSGISGVDWSEKGISLADALRSVRHDLKDFFRYGVAVRTLLLRARGLNPGISAKDAKYVVEQLETPAFKKALVDVTAWGNMLMDYLVDSGGLSPENAKAIRALNPVWLSFARYFNEAMVGGAPGAGKKGMVNQGKGIKRFKGSGRQINDLMQNLAQQAEFIFNLGNKLQVARATATFADRAGKSAWFAHKITAPQEATKFTLDKILPQLVELGIVDADSVLQSKKGAAILTPEGDVIDADQLMTVFQNATSYFGKDNIAVIWRNGKREFWWFDPEVYRTITEMDKEHLPPWLSAFLGPPMRLARLGAVSLSPEFGLRNPLKDALTYAVYSVTGYKSISDKALGPGKVLTGLWESLIGSDAKNRWDATGGRMATIMGQDASEIRFQMEEALATGKLEKGGQIIRHPIHALRALIGIGESGPRLTEYKGLYKEGMEKWGNPRAANVYAALGAKDVTVNFTRRGLAGQVLNQVYLFFNARVQGAAKFYRVFSGAEGRRQAPGDKHAGAKAAFRATVRAFQYITIPNLLLWWLNKDEKWYREMRPWERYGFLHINFSDNPNKPDYSIPGPFELQYVFGGMPVAAMDSLYRDDPEAIEDAMLEAFESFLPIEPNAYGAIPTALRPTVEVGSGRKGFPELRDIVSSRQEGQKLDKDLYNKWTTESAKILGEVLDVSPAKIEHFASGHTGGLILDLVRFVEGMAGYRELEIPLAGAITHRTALGHGASIDEIYDRRNKLKKKRGSKETTSAEDRELKKLERAITKINALRKRRDAGKMDEDRANAMMTDIARKALGKPYMSSAAPVRPSPLDKVNFAELVA